PTGTSMRAGEYDMFSTVRVTCVDSPAGVTDAVVEPLVAAESWGRVAMSVIARTAVMPPSAHAVRARGPPSTPGCGRGPGAGARSGTGLAGVAFSGGAATRRGLVAGVGASPRPGVVSGVVGVDERFA